MAEKLRTFKKEQKGFPMEIIRNRPTLDGKLSANSFLSPCSTNGPKSDKKLSANSFLSLCSTTAPCQTGNYPRTVSCRHAPPLPHAGQETIREQFPVAMLRHCPTPDGKLSANSFLPLCSTTAPCRMGNLSQTVSCHHAPPLPHDAQETIREQFPVAMLHHCPMPDGKLSANSFLSLCSTTAPCCTGNFSQAASYHHAPPLPHAAQETFRKQLPIIMLRHCPTPDGKP